MAEQRLEGQQKATAAVQTQKSVQKTTVQKTTLRLSSLPLKIQRKEDVRAAMTGGPPEATHTQRTSSVES